MAKPIHPQAFLIAETKIDLDAVRAALARSTQATGQRARAPTLTT